MEEIGNHFKFEEFKGDIYHPTNLLFSSGRNCFRYILRKRSIQKVFLPYFLCETVAEAAINENVEIEFYHINQSLLPIITKPLNEGEYIYLVNYYGMLTGDPIRQFLDKYSNVIIDNTHNFFDQNEYSTDVIYNFRKYFGIPDGACIVSDLSSDETIERSRSLNRIIEFVEREESNKFFHYSTFQEADQYFHNEELCYISKFSENHLRGIDYHHVYEIRKNNFGLLHQKLGEYSPLSIGKELNFMYPLYTENGSDLRKYLLENKIYSLLLWPNVFHNGANEMECRLAQNMVLLPLDQRYSDQEMSYINSTIDRYMEKQKILKL